MSENRMLFSPTRKSLAWEKGKSVSLSFKSGNLKEEKMLPLCLSGRRYQASEKSPLCHAGDQNGNGGMTYGSRTERDHHSYVHTLSSGFPLVLEYS